MFLNRIRPGVFAEEVRNQAGSELLELVGVLRLEDWVVIVPDPLDDDQLVLFSGISESFLECLHGLRELIHKFEVFARELVLRELDKLELSFVLSSLLPLKVLLLPLVLEIRIAEGGLGSLIVRPIEGLVYSSHIY